MFKKTLFQIHWFLGITAGLILSLMGVTGAIYSYESQILKWLNSESYQVVVAPNQSKLNPEQLYQHFIQQDPNIKINSITIAKDANTSSSLNIAKEGERRGKTIMVNPYTAEVLPEIKGREFFQFIQQLHRNLTVGEFGKQITGACTLMLIYFVLSGLYLRLPKKHSLRQWFFIKPKLKGRNFIWDLHAVVGTWVIIFYLIFAMTGLYWSYDWWRNGMFTVLGVERPQPQMQAGEHKTGLGQGEGSRGERQPRGEGRGGRNAQQQHISLSTVQISQALHQSWTGFTAQLNRDYTSITLNLPKTDDGKLEIAFVDAPAQHERARNSATYNYQTAQIEKLELYETKKLNEKIMGSMLPVHRGSFMGGIYQFFAMLASLAMPLFLVTGWMLYLKRRKQKKLTQSARSGLSSLTLDPNAPQWTILYASQTGMAEQIAYNTSTALQQAGVPTQVKALKSCTPEHILEFKRVLFVVSTYGTGDAPDLAVTFAKKYMAQPHNFAGLQYAILALGSKEYPETYCTFGHQLHTWLTTSQAQAIFPVQEVDNGNQADLQQWYSALAQMTHKEVHAVMTEKTFDDWQLVSRKLMNSNSQGEPVFEVVLQPLSDESWHAGDILEIQPANNADLPSREYSIASIPQDKLLRLVVRQKQLTDGLGLGSGWLTQHAEVGTKIQARIRTNPSFHLIDDNRPIICIGNGTGIAGLMSLLKQREQLGFTQNWLIFGERQQAIDFFYQTQIQTWQQTGVLQHVDVAFSRDQAERIYVQDKLREQQERLKAWIAQDAVLYICGSIDGMAGGVEHTLIDILGEDTLDDLRQADRYRRDVY